MVFQKLDRFADVGLLIVRIGLGLSFAFAHGMGKLFGGPARWEKVGANAAYVGLDFLPTFFGFMASVSEFVGGLLLAAGLLFRPSLFFLIVTMSVAAAYHIGSGNGSPTHAIELALVLLGLVFTGPGKYSLDHLWSRRKRMGM